MAEESHSDSTTDSEEEDAVLTVIEAKGMLRDIITLCERQPHKRSLAEARAKAQGDPRAAMLSVVPMVVEVAEEALARRAKNKRQAATHTSTSKTHDHHTSAHRQAGSTGAPREPLLAAFLREAQFLVGADSSGFMKKDMATLRSLLSPP